MQSEPLLPSAQKASTRTCSFVTILIFFILSLFLHVHRHKVKHFLEIALGTDAYEEVIHEPHSPEIPRPPDVSPNPSKRRSSGGKAPMRPQDIEMSSQAGSSSQAGGSSLAGGTLQARSSSRTGPSQAGGSSQSGSSSEAGPSSRRRPSSPEISIVTDDFSSKAELSGHELLSRQYQSDARERVNRINPIQSLYGDSRSLADVYQSGTCGDGENGFEVKVQLCETVQIFYEFRLTVTSSVMVPMVLKPDAACVTRVCSERDTYQCCRPRRMCSAYYAKDVTEGCPANEIVNPYKGAFCRTVPCTIGDIDTCCIEPGELWQRTDFLRSKYARVIPDDSSAPAIPHISFGYHDIVWLDIHKKQTVNGDEWCPLVNFMSTWGFGGKGWDTAAWIRLSKKGKAGYKQFTREQLAPPPRSNLSPQGREQEDQQRFSAYPYMSNDWIP